MEEPNAKFDCKSTKISKRDSDAMPSTFGVEGQRIDQYGISKFTLMNQKRGMEKFHCGSREKDIMGKDVGTFTRLRTNVAGVGAPSTFALLPKLRSDTKEVKKRTRKLPRRRKE